MSAALARAFEDIPIVQDGTDPRRLKVFASRLPDVDALRAERTVPHGLTVEEIVRLMLPGGTRLTYQRTHVWLVTRDGEELLDRRAWRARPKPHVTLVIRVEPGKNALASILQIVVAIGAAIFAPYLAGALFGSGTFLAGVAAGALQLGFNIAGGLLVNALFPTDNRQQSAPRQTWAATGWSNELRRDAPLPRLKGRLRMAPIYAVPPVMEVRGNDVWLRTVFMWGYGPIHHDQHKIGNTPIGEFEIDTIEHRYGLPGDAPLPDGFNRTVISHPLGGGGLMLTRPRPKKENGEPDPDQPGVSKPVTRRCARDASGASVIYCFPYGLFDVNDDGERQANSVTIVIRQRKWGETEWTEVVSQRIREKRDRAFYREHEWTFSERGDWEVEMELMDSESTKAGKVQDVQWVVLKSIKPEYPINFGKPLALTGILIKSSEQLNGQLDQFNGVGTSIANDFMPAGEDGGEWTEQQTSWPPALTLEALQGNANPFPVSDDRIDWPAFEEWHRFCVLKGLEYCRLHDSREPLRNTLKAIGAAGRAVVHFNGVKWTVIIDRPREAPVAHLSARNCSEIRGRVDFLKLPDAFRVTFRDRTSEWEPKDMVVPFPGRVPPFDRVEKIDRPWITNPPQLFRDVRRYQLELLNRHVTWTAIQRRAVRSASFGDMVIASRDFLAPGVHSARVKSRRGRLVEIDDAYEFAAGQNYWVRFLRHAEASQLPSSVLRPVKPLAGLQSTFRLDGEGEAPRKGDIVHLVPATGGGIEMILTRREAGRDKTSVLTLKAAAPQIDAELDATPVPPWDGRTGTIIGGEPPAPAVPEIVAVLSGLAATGAADGLIVMLAPGTHSSPVGTFEVQHRDAGAELWSGPVAAPAVNGAVDLSGLYDPGDPIELQARALTYGGTPGAWSATRPHTVAAADGDVPAAISAEAVTLSGGPGHVVITIANGTDAATTAIQIFHRDDGDPLDEDADKLGAPIAVEPSQSYGRVVGDGTRANPLANAGFVDASAWTAGLWAIAAGVASKTAGSAGDISQALTLPAGDYAVAFDVTAVTAGQVRPRLIGGTPHAGADGAFVGTVGRHRAIVSSDGTKTAFAVDADAAFDGAIDNAVIYRRTPGSLSAGLHHFWFKPLGATLSGPLLGPIAIDID